jgi:hypothetical protein
MSYDFDYYSGKDLLYPIKPTKPTLGRNPNAIEARAWAEALEEYERELESYTENRNWYNSQINSRQNELCKQIRDDYDITEAQFAVIWRQAWEDGHHAGLSEVVIYFDRYYEMATEFAALEKG